MIKYDEALTIAKSHREKINRCTEHENAYIFAYDDGSAEVVVGSAPIVVMKEDGRIAGGFPPILDGSIGERIREIDV